MKKTRKALLLGVCAVLLVTASVLGTIAYLTSTDAVTNTFTVGNVTITLDEAKVDEKGNEIMGEGAARVKANEYKLMPGHTYKKDPTVHVAAGSEDCYVFVKVENGIANLEATGNTTIAKQMETQGWSLVTGETNIYAYKNTVAAGTDVKVFESFKIADDANTKTEWNSITNAQVKITAYAIQKDGFNDANAAWAAGNF